MKTNELRHELKKLTDLGYIQEAQLDLIEQDIFSKSAGDKSNNRLILIFALLAVVFIGAGIISIFAFNWSMFSRELKSIFAFVPLLITQGLLYQKQRQHASDVWIQSLSLAVGLSFLSALALIYQAYQLSYSLNSMLLITFLLMLPLVYLLDAYYLAIFALIGVLSTSFITNPNYILLVLLLLPYYITRYKKEQDSKTLTLLFIIWTLSLPSYLHMENSLFLSLLLLFILAITKIDVGYKKLAKIALYLLAFIIAVEEYNIYYFSHISNVGIPFILLLILTVGIYIISYPKHIDIHEKLDFTALSIFGLSIVSLILIAPQIEINPAYMFIFSTIFNVFIVALSILKIAVGLKQDELGSARRYIFILNAYVLVKIFSSNIGLLLKGICLIAVGIGFLVTNYMLAKRKGIRS